MSFMESLPRPTKTYHTKSYDRLPRDHGFEGAGKTVLITGGAGGVGLAISKAFAESGVSRLVIVARSEGPQAAVKAELEVAHPRLQVVTHAASITDRARTAEILRDLETSGGLDVLVLCAGVAHRRVAAAEVSPKEVSDAFDINAAAAFNWTQAYLASPSPKDKTVINVSSAVAQMRNPMRAAYGPSKAAGVQIMQAFVAEVEWKQKMQQQQKGESDGEETTKTRIFSFHPGSLYTPGTAEHFAKDALEWDDIDLPAHFARWLAGPQGDFLHGRFLLAQWDVDELVVVKEKLAANPAALTIGLIQL
ncbi:hypothetical protein PG996_015017 [Apiospora saccharicola]|uniref:Ketoreductase domain-containing protein n=1 Tax=Apiospora saccharicola TaxID=335842 RepID=A0ABR1TMP3_9PEZI